MAKEKISGQFRIRERMLLSFILHLNCLFPPFADYLCKDGGKARQKPSSYCKLAKTVPRSIEPRKGDVLI